MITTSEARRSRVFEIAVALSLIVHLLVLLIYVGFFQRLLADERRLQQKPDDFVALSDSIRIEKRTIPRPSVVQPIVPVPPQPRPRPVARPVPVPKPIAAPTPVERREVARLVPNAAPRARAAPKTIPAETQQVPRRTETGTVAGITGDDPRYRAAIAETNQGLRNLPVQNVAPSAIKTHTDRVLGYTQREIQTAQGDTVHYEAAAASGTAIFLARQFLFSDNKIETIGFPWPYYFTDRFDPFESGAGGLLSLSVPVSAAGLQAAAAVLRLTRDVPRVRGRVQGGARCRRTQRRPPRPSRALTKSRA